MLNSVVKISVMFAKYFEYYTIILRGPFFRGQDVDHRGAHWRNLANTTEPSMCDGDTALCQITLTTCYHY